MALQCRHDQIAQQKRDQPNHHQLIHRSSSGESAKSSSDPSDRDRDCHHRSSRDYDRDRDRDRDRYWDRDQDSKRRRVLREEQMSREQVRLEKLAEQEREKELEVIKEQYLGSKKSKKRVIKPSEKFRFSFDWENTEDTSRDMNSLYQNPHEARLLFGRGFQAGMDQREQKKLAAKNEKEIRDEIRKKDGIEEKLEVAAAQRLKDVEEVIRRDVAHPNKIAVDGHSYGAFMTTNLLVHAPHLFCCGIAHSGAYNKTLTPFGFQNEDRTLWEATSTYVEMSPFVSANKIKKPILLIHGEEDNNSGTLTMQSDCFFNALKGHGALCHLVILPFESHDLVSCKDDVSKVNVDSENKVVTTSEKGVEELENLEFDKFQSTRRSSLW